MKIRFVKAIQYVFANSADILQGLEFPQNSVSQNQMPQNLSPTNTSYSLNTPPPVPKPSPVPVPPIVQVVTPAVPNAASTPLEDTFSRLVNGNWVGAASNASTYYHPPKQNTGAMDEVAAYFLDKKREEENKKRIQKTNQSYTAVGCLMILVLFGVVGFFAHEQDKQRWKKEAQAERADIKRQILDVPTAPVVKRPESKYIKEFESAVRDILKERYIRRYKGIPVNESGIDLSIDVYIRPYYPYSEKEFVSKHEFGEALIKNMENEIERLREKRKYYRTPDDEPPGFYATIKDLPSYIEVVKDGINKM